MNAQPIVLEAEELPIEVFHRWVDCYNSMGPRRRHSWRPPQPHWAVQAVMVLSQTDQSRTPLTSVAQVKNAINSSEARQSLGVLFLGLIPRTIGIVATSNRTVEFRTVTGGRDFQWGGEFRIDPQYAGQLGTYEVSAEILDIKASNRRNRHCAISGNCLSSFEGAPNVDHGDFLIRLR